MSLCSESEIHSNPSTLILKNYIFQAPLSSGCQLGLANGTRCCNTGAQEEVKTCYHKTASVANFQVTPVISPIRPSSWAPKSACSLPMHLEGSFLLLGIVLQPTGFPSNSIPYEPHFLSQIPSEIPRAVSFFPAGLRLTHMVKGIQTFKPETHGLF